MAMSTANKALIWGVSGLAAAMLALTSYAALSGDDDAGAASDKKGGSTSATASAKPAPDYSAPGEWTEPERWTALPRGKRTDDNGNDVGFPHTTEGAVAMLAATNATTAEDGRGMADELRGVYESYFSGSDQSPAKRAKVTAEAARREAAMRRDLGVPAKGDMPPGAYIRATVIGYKIIKASPDEVSVYLLSRVTMKAGETEKEHGSYARNVVAARWEGKDWKLSSAAISLAVQQVRGKALPAIVAPGDAAFNTNGWIAIRQAS